jgi:hypothetical protein
MKVRVVVSLFALAAAAAFGQELGGGGGVQFSGVVSENFINDFINSTASNDTVAGLSYIQLNATYKDGPFGFDSQGSMGPGGAGYLKYVYGFAEFWNGRVHLSIGKWVDPDTFALNSFFVGGSDGPGSYGNPSVVNATGVSGQGVTGIELKVSPVKDLVIGASLPYQYQTDTVDTSLRRVFGVVSYTLEKEVQLVAGYTQSHTGVADLPTPINNLDQNKFYTIANVLVSDSLVLGGRYELDHDVSSWSVISHNAYFTLGDKFGAFSIGGDVGLYFPRGASVGYEILGITSYTFKSVIPSVDLQPYVTASYVSGSYEESPYTSINVNPQLRFLLGKNQHELAAGYTITYDLDHRQIVVSQLNILIQLYF